MHHSSQIIRARPWLVFLGLALIVLGPLLLPGYVLTVDLSWGPHMAASDMLSNTAPLWWLIRALSVVLPGWVVEKLVLVGLPVLTGVGMWRLAARRSPGWSAYAAGLMYVVNPFTYERLMAGQWLVLAGYALLPWLVDALLRLLERPGARRALVLGAWAVGLGMASLHLLPMAALLLAAVIAASAWGRGWRPHTGRWLALATALWLAAASAWLVPWLLHRSAAARAVAGFDAGQFEAFRTTAGPLGAPAAVAALQGFWGERTGLVVPGSSTGAWFWLAAATILILAIIGLVLAVRRRDRLGLALAVAASLAWLLAIGVAWPPTAALTHLLVDHLPFYRGYREPQKWAALIALAYAYLASGALAAAGTRLQPFWRRGLLAATAVLVFAWAPLLPWGAAGQLTATAYPAGWSDLNARLNALPAAPPGHPDTLMLPWHQYIYLDFAHRPVANPSAQFFDRPGIVSNDPELPGVPPDSDLGIVNKIQNDVIDRRFFEHNAGSRLRALGVHYVVLIKVSDWQNYGWLRAQSDLTLVAETPDWQLYQAIP
ncbi:MAG TPA: hypothetical protein VMT30_04515 [Candidatus Saccharimonadia bacterium]|nr:hypothetical protein [Candidatus Saccharimonadia bacterium]